MRGHIYGGIDADTREMRYVGLSKKPVGRRPHNHEWHAARGASFPVHRWIRKRKSDGRGLEWIVIEYLMDDDPRTLEELEIGWIAHFRALGCRLTNCTAGGEGVLAPNAATVAKMSAWQKGRPLSVAHRARISAALKGRPLSTETKAKMSATRRGRRHTPESRVRMSESAIRRSADPAYREKLSLAAKRREERRRSQSVKP